MGYLYLSIGGALVGLLGLFLTRFVKGADKDAGDRRHAG